MPPMHLLAWAILSWHLWLLIRLFTVLSEHWAQNQLSGHGISLDCPSCRMAFVEAPIITVAQTAALVALAGRVLEVW